MVDGGGCKYLLFARYLVKTVNWTTILLDLFKLIFVTFYHGKMPSNHYLGEYVLLYPSILSESKSFKWVPKWVEPTLSLDIPQLFVREQVRQISKTSIQP